MGFRNECVDILSSNFGIACDAHHHEVATAGQCEIDIRYDTLVNAADSVQSYKYIVKNVAKKHNMIATMMPKPIALDNGSGLHVDVSLWNDNTNWIPGPGRSSSAPCFGRCRPGTSTRTWASTTSRTMRR